MTRALLVGAAVAIFLVLGSACSDDSGDSDSTTSRPTDDGAATSSPVSTTEPVDGPTTAPAPSPTSAEPSPTVDDGETPSDAAPTGDVEEATPDDPAPTPVPAEVETSPLAGPEEGISVEEATELGVLVADFDARVTIRRTTGEGIEVLIENVGKLPDTYMLELSASGEVEPELQLAVGESAIILVTGVADQTHLMVTSTGSGTELARLRLNPPE